ncbi:MAG TPA: zinc-binding dehydrogenase [Kribbella sp.]|nr:zinc-binding dehydrogenase [Kribbella sp.]
MRAVWLKEFGAPEMLVVRQVPDPVAGRGQVVIEVEFANVTFVETQFRAAGAGPVSATPPLIPGNGVGGVVAEVGEDVDRGLLGRRVVSSLGGTGGYAERAVADAAALIPVPERLAMDQAVALLADGRTAILLARTASVREGDRVLVEAAAGGVGTLLVQLARNAGARVVGLAGGARKVDVVRELGAEVAIDYRVDGWDQRVRDAVGGVDVVFDGVGGAVARSAFGLLEGGGRMLSYGLASGSWMDISPEEAAERGVQLLQTQAGLAELRALTAEALRAGAAGRLRPVIGQRYPLDQAAAAHAAIEARTTVGKTLLVV